MQMIFQAVGGFHTEASSCTWSPVASFTTRAAALAFIKAENDEVQADMLSLEEITCVDDYGFPMTRAEWERTANPLPSPNPPAPTGPNRERPAPMLKPTALTLSERAAEAAAVSIALPGQFLARDVFLGASREGRKWRIGAVDRVGNRYPVSFGGVRDETLYLSRRQAFEALNAKGLKVGAKVWALPEAKA